MEERQSEQALTRQQKEVCERYDAVYVACDPALKVGIAWNVKSRMEPIHGLRLPPVGDTTGWYIWSGEYSEADDFFVPLHAAHVRDWNPLLLPYLGLAPGWRFVIATDYEDIWFDEALLQRK